MANNEPEVDTPEEDVEPANPQMIDNENPEHEPDNREENTELPNPIEEEFINTLLQEQTAYPQPDPQAAARILSANEDVANRLNNQDKKVDINLKIIYGVVILVLLLIWIFFVICFSNKQLEPNSEKMHHISDTVFVTLLTTATANIIALPTIILKYLFSHQKN